MIQNEGSMLMPFDIEKTADGSFSTKRSALKIAEFFGIKDLRQADQRVIDTFVLSNILNYVDYKQVLKELSAFLKPKGLMIVNNLIHNGAMNYKHLFSPNKPIEVDGIERVMEDLRFTKIDSVPTWMGLKEDFIRVFELNEPPAVLTSSSDHLHRD